MTVPRPDATLTYDQWLTAICLWREARGESKRAIRAIYWVIQNRVLDSRWPRTHAEVILQPKQFSSFMAGDPNSSRFPTPSSGRDWDAYWTCVEVVQDPGTDPTGGANHYESCPDDHEPRWAINVIHREGPFEFYKT